MNIQDYKDTYKSYSPAQKVDILLDAIDHYGFCRAMSYAARNPYEKSVYCHEVDDKELKIKWLCEEIKKALEDKNIVRGYDLGKAEAFCEMAKIIGGTPVALVSVTSDIASGLIKTAIKLNDNPDAPEEIMSITDDNISDYVAGIIIGRKDKNNGSEVQAQ